MARQPYPGDLTDEVRNAIFYLLCIGCHWRYLPHDDFPTDYRTENVFAMHDHSQDVEIQHDKPHRDGQ